MKPRHQFVLLTALSVFTVINLVPILWGLIISLKQPADAFSIPPTRATNCRSAICLSRLGELVEPAAILIVAVGRNKGRSDPSTRMPPCTGDAAH